MGCAAASSCRQSLECLRELTHSVCNNPGRKYASCRQRSKCNCACSRTTRNTPGKCMLAAPALTLHANRNAASPTAHALGDVQTSGTSPAEAPTHATCNHANCNAPSTMAANNHATYQRLEAGQVSSLAGERPWRCLRTNPSSLRIQGATRRQNAHTYQGGTILAGGLCLLPATHASM